MFDAQGRRIAEYNEATGAIIREYVWMGWDPVAVIEGGVIYLIRADHIGRPAFATTLAGTKVWSAVYLPFGGVHVTTGAPIDARFPGQWFQTEAGLYQNWMRDYDPTTGRYIEADPLGLVDGASVYGYAGGNPGRYVDPRGKESGIPTSPPEAIPGGPWEPAGPGQRPGTFFGPKQPIGPRETLRWVPPEGRGGPPGSEGYWKTTKPGQGSWGQRYDQKGNPITPEEAHPGRRLPPTRIPLGPIIILPINPSAIFPCGFGRNDCVQANYNPSEIESSCDSGVDDRTDLAIVMLSGSRIRQ